MYYLTKEFRFEASHQLMYHDGKCARLHGHSWKGKVICEYPNVIGDGPKRNMAQDYGDIKTHIELWVSGYLDHFHLNETLGTESPTSEFIARWLYERLKQSIPALVAVEINETCTTSCRYQPHPIENPGAYGL